MIVTGAYLRRLRETDRTRNLTMQPDVRSLISTAGRGDERISHLSGRTCEDGHRAGDLREETEDARRRWSSEATHRTEAC